MSINSNSHLLSASIKDLSFTEHFREVAENLHFKTIGEIVKVKVSEIMKLPGFTYHFWQELVQFLKETGLNHLLIQE